MALIDAKQLSSLRKEYGVSQTELAEYLGYKVLLGLRMVMQL